MASIFAHFKISFSIQFYLPVFSVKVTWKTEFRFRIQPYQCTIGQVYLILTSYRGGYAVIFSIPVRISIIDNRKNQQSVCSLFNAEAICSGQFAGFAIG
ncbi:hypothetical protein D3C85_724200 [compost metagenome]